MNKFKLGGRFYLTVRDKSGLIIARRTLKNAPVNEGLDAVLNIMFHGTTQITSWYIGLINNVDFSALDPDDVMADHAGWNELTSYDESARQLWVNEVAASQIITNLPENNAIFTATGAISVKGAFLTSSSTKGGTTGTLWATAVEGSAVAVADDQTIALSYSLTGSAG